MSLSLCLQDGLLDKLDDVEQEAAKNPDEQVNNKSLETSVLHIFETADHWCIQSHQQHDMGCTEDQLSKMCKTEGSTNNHPIVNEWMIAKTFSGKLDEGRR